MKLRKLFPILVAACSFIAAAQASASPVLLVNSSGVLTGAKNVDVDDTLYNVTFVNGSCNSVFNRCSEASFSFVTIDSAVDAANALLNQVFIDGPAGQFDSNPEKTFGCGRSPFLCEVVMPYKNIPLYQNFVGAIAENRSPKRLPDDLAYPAQMDSTADFSDSSRIFAIFKVAPRLGDVPEPASIALLGLGGAAIGIMRRRKS